MFNFDLSQPYEEAVHWINYCKLIHNPCRQMKHPCSTVFSFKKEICECLLE